MFLVSEDIIENLICDGCKKYLSVSPVKVYSNKQILCGRCSKDSDGGVISMYNNVFQQGLFKCINRFDGCNEAIIYSEVANHEVNCKSNLYKCPNCILTNKMPSLLLKNHFRECHRNNLLKKSSFSINANESNDDGKYLYIQDNFLFTIWVCFNYGKLLLNIYHIGNEAFSEEIKQSFLLSSSDGTLNHYKTGVQPCSKYYSTDSNNLNFENGFTINVTLKQGCTLNVDFDVDTQKVRTFLLMRTVYHVDAKVKIEEQPEDQNGYYQILADENEIYLSEKFKKTWSQLYSLHSSGQYVVKGSNNKPLKECSICHNKFQHFSSNQSVYKCTDCNLMCGTYICSKCYFFGFKKCGKKNYEFAPEETTAAKDIQYFCRWKCGEKCFSWELKNHEYNCNHQIVRICPIEKCEWKGKLFEITDHINSHVNSVFYDNHSFPLRLIKSTNFSFKNELIVPVLNYFVSVKWKKIGNHYMFSLTIKDNKDKFPVAIVSTEKGKIDIFDNFFVRDDVEGAPLLLVTIR